MNIYAAASLFAILILLYWVISEVFTVLFRLIGLPEEKARFQVISLLTGTGFTTRESEMILSTRSRRRLARITVLFGYVFNITFVSTVVNVFLSAGAGGFGSSMGVSTCAGSSIDSKSSALTGKISSQLVTTVVLLSRRIVAFLRE